MLNCFEGLVAGGVTNYVGCPFWTACLRTLCVRILRQDSTPSSSQGRTDGHRNNLGRAKGFFGLGHPRVATAKVIILGGLGRKQRAQPKVPKGRWPKKKRLQRYSGACRGQVVISPVRGYPIAKGLKVDTSSFPQTYSLLEALLSKLDCSPAASLVEFCLQTRSTSWTLAAPTYTPQQPIYEGTSAAGNPRALYSADPSPFLPFTTQEASRVKGALACRLGWWLDQRESMSFDGDKNRALQVQRQPFGLVWELAVWELSVWVPSPHFVAQDCDSQSTRLCAELCFGAPHKPPPMALEPFPTSRDLGHCGLAKDLAKKAGLDGLLFFLHVENLPLNEAAEHLGRAKLSELEHKAGVNFRDEGLQVPSRPLTRPPPVGAYTP